MATFTYTARAFNGDLRTATIDASSRDDVIAQLRKQRLSVVKIDQDATKKIGRGAIKTRDVVIFTRQFSTMINSGLPLVQALTILAEQTDNKALAEVTRKVVFDVESGNTVADALSKHPRAFTNLYVNMVAAGEAGGILDTILLRLATFLEKNDALVRKVKGAMIYPAVIMSVAAIAVMTLLIFVIPVFAGMFASAGQALPPADPNRHRCLGLPQGLLVGHRCGHHRRRLLLQEVLCFAGRKARDRPGNASLPGTRRRAAQVRGVTFHADARNTHQLGGQHSRRTRDYGEDGWQPRHSGRDHAVPFLDRRR